MTRTLPALKLERSPLVFVLAQLRFSAVLQLERFVPEIQERVRHKGFPLFAQLQSRGVRIGPKTEFFSNTRYAFMNKDQSAAVILAPDFVVLETNKYDVFERFVGEFENVLSIIGDVAKPAVAERLGLRYVDLMRGDYTKNVVPGLAGLPLAPLGVKSVQARLEFVGSAPQGNFIIRLHQVEGRFLPPDLDPIPLRYTDLEVPPGEVVSLLDLDSFDLEQRDFEPRALVTKMWQLHDFTDRAFRSCVTTDALKAWGARAL